MYDLRRRPDEPAAMTVRGRVLRGLARVPGAATLARLTVETVRVCMRYRVTGLASEAGFFALLSLPPLLFGLFGGAGYVGRWLGPDTVAQVSQAISVYAARFLTDASVRDVIVPTVDDVLGNGRSDVISIGLLVSVWSGSRALNVFVDTISIMYGQSGVRGIIRTRVLSLSLYFISILIGGDRHPAGAHRALADRRAPAEPAGLPQRAVLARRGGGDHREPHDAVPHQHAAALAVGAGHPGRGAGPDHLGAVPRSSCGSTSATPSAAARGPSTARWRRPSWSSSGCTSWPSPCSSGRP